jgi:hypothetical protein
MAAYTKFLDFVDQLGQGKHIFGTHVFKCVLSLSAPVNTNTILANITQIASGNGYTTDGEDAQVTWAEAAGTGTATGTKIVWTSSGAGMAAFQYVTLYNYTQGTPVKPLVGFWNYGSSLTLGVGETFSVKFNSSDTTGTIFTLA